MAVSNTSEIIHLVVACIICYRDKLLLCKSPKWSNKWVVPGGHIEYGEKILEAAVREGKEETGLDLVPMEIIGFGEEFNPPEFIKLGHVVYFVCLLGSKVGDDLKLGEEISEARWVTLVEAKSYDLSRVHRRIIRKYEEYQKAA